jgi:hypothetical protein
MASQFKASSNGGKTTIERTNERTNEWTNERTNEQTQQSTVAEFIWQPVSWEGVCIQTMIEFILLGFLRVHLPDRCHSWEGISIEQQSPIYSVLPGLVLTAMLIHHIEWIQWPCSHACEMAVLIVLFIVSVECRAFAGDCLVDYRPI